MRGEPRTLLEGARIDLALLSAPRSNTPAHRRRRRRRAVVLVRLRMSESVKEAAALVEQGHVRVGPETVTDPAFHVTRAMEDCVTWAAGSKIKRKVARYNDALDDYDLLAA